MPTAAAETSAHVAQPWLACPFPGRFTVPTMLTPEEVNYLHWLGREFHSGGGRVVDLGCFFGGSTVALATGMAANPKARPPLLTYDSFVMDATAERMFLHPYRAGESFRPLFDVMTTRVRDAVTVREGWLPESIDRAGERALYPEQEPIEVLFVDVAKTWDVHLTVLRAFARHLIPGRSLLVQQDFKHFYQFWIPIHMHQVRDCFRPVHDVPRSATLTFEYVRGLEERLDGLMRPGAITDAGAIGALWDEIEASWNEPTAAHVVMTLKLNRAMHFCRARLMREAVASIESFSAWFARSCPRDVAHIGRAECATAARIIEQHAGAFARPALDSLVERLGGALRAVSPSSDAVSTEGSWLRSCLWRHAAARCRDLGAERVALYPAGRHTRAMLDAGFPFGEPFELAALVDDAPSAASIRSIPVLRPHDAPKDIDAILISSDAHEDAMATAAHRAFGRRDIPILRIYTPDTAAERLPISSGIPASSSRRSPNSGER